MGVYNAELFTNLGLCCFYAQQYDMALHCFQRALDLASDETTADVWYNIGHVALVGCTQYLGDMLVDNSVLGDGSHDCLEIMFVLRSGAI